MAREFKILKEELQSLQEKFYKTAKIEGKPVEFFKNPTLSDVSDLLKKDENFFQDLRLTYDIKTKTLFMFDPFVSHRSANYFLFKGIPSHVFNIRVIPKQKEGIYYFPGTSTKDEAYIKGLAAFKKDGLPRLERLFKGVHFVNDTKTMLGETHGGVDLINESNRASWIDPKGNVHNVGLFNHIQAYNKLTGSKTYNYTSAFNKGWIRTVTTDYGYHASWGVNKISSAAKKALISEMTVSESYVLELYEGASKPLETLETSNTNEAKRFINRH